MTQEIINVGSSPDDGQGDPLRTAFVKINSNFTQLFGADSNGYSYISSGTSNVNIGNANGNITMSANGTSNVVVISNTTVSVTGAVTANTLTLNGTAAAGSGVLIVSGNIQTSSANATANIGNVNNYFNRLFAQSTSAIYSDLAEMYESDAEYAPGTVLSFGGSKEVTVAQISNDQRVAGVVSTNPAHIMNSGIQAQFAVAVALTGRVPTSVTGTVAKGDMMVSAGNGYAQACATPAMGTVIGKALQDHSGDSGIIEIVVGRM